ncbi:MAG: hypothetical protein JWN25_3535, partial [Verrucomicrobiales bacterium]|nr:hypothetical protein [Verrucomicrobiales bacterium]
FADKNTAAGADHANFNLSKLGTSIGIYSSTGVLINAVTFGKQVSNISQGRFPDGASPIVSFPVSSSPQESNYLPLPNVVVNEVLSRASQPAEPAIELQNSGATDLNIGGWYLGTDQSGLISYQIPAGTIIPAGDYKVFYAHDWSSAFALDAARGGQVQLTQSDTFGVPTGYRSQVKFGAAADGVSFARYTNSVGRIEFVASTAPSLGLVNSSPVLGEVVINEIMYHPVGVGTNNNVLDEFVELANVSGHSVSLFDPAFPVNTWKLSGGVGFSFPMNVSIPANGFAVVVSFDPATDSASLSEFRSRYAVPAGVPIYGPFSGHLDNANDTVKLSRPDAPLSLSSSSPGFVPYIAVEAIQYSNAVPWPTGGDGTGNSLLRKSPVAFGDDPLAWTVGAATAGKPNSGTAPGDSDGDGLADSWEIVYFGSINDPRATASADPDFDGANNLQEFIAGTNPLDAGSRLQINVPVVTANSISLSFSAVAGKSYSVLYRDSLAQGSWLKLSDVSPQSQDGLVTVQDSTVRNPAGRFYLIVTPAIP